MADEGREEVTYSIDIEAPAAGERTEPRPAETTAGAAAPGPSPPPGDQQLLDRVTAAERRANEAWAYVQPLLNLLPQQQDPNRPKIKTLEELQYGQDVTPADLVNYIQDLQEKQVARLSGYAEQTARRAASEQRVRGQLTAEAMGGPGRDYDSLRARHLAPLYEQNPSIQQLVAQQEDPALAEYTLAFFHEVASRFGGDPIKTFQHLWNGLHAYQQGAQDLGNRIAAAARTQADRVLAGGGSVAGPSRKVDATAIWNMSDEEFRRLEAQYPARG